MNDTDHLKTLTPHTPEWFEALDGINPRQAVLTRAAIAFAGSTEVCSVCSDAPADDYDMPGAKLLARLCVGCKRIQDQK